MCVHRWFFLSLLAGVLLGVGCRDGGASIPNTTRDCEDVCTIFYQCWDGAPAEEECISDCVEYLAKPSINCKEDIGYLAECSRQHPDCEDVRWNCTLLSSSRCNFN
jgi:hypothetical protein